jgi:hypothetical protein
MAKKAVAKKKGEQPAEAEYVPPQVIAINEDDLKAAQPDEGPEQQEENPVVGMSRKEVVFHLQWIYDRLKVVHNESEHFDYMVKLKEIIDGM